MTSQRLIGQPIARLSDSVDPPIELLDGLLAYEWRALLVHVVGVLPKFTLRTPAMRRALKAVLDLYAQIHAGIRRRSANTSAATWSTTSWICIKRIRSSCPKRTSSLHSSRR